MEGETLRKRLRTAWQGRISGCQLGKPVEALSMLKGKAALDAYLREAGAEPLRDYITFLEGHEDSGLVAMSRRSCRDQLTRSEPDDDINYTVLALLMLEQHGAALTTEAVARAWLRYLPAGWTFTAELAAYRTLLANMGDYFAVGAELDFDLALCSDNPYNEWIGAQIRADLYGWVCPGRPRLAADLARRDAALSHRGDGVHGAAFVAALGAAIPLAGDLAQAIEIASEAVPADSRARQAIAFGRELVGDSRAVARLHERYADLSAVHTLNNLALVVWGLLSGESDFAVAIGDTVAAGWDTDCNGATVGGLWGVTGREIPESFLKPWNGTVAVELAGHSEFALADLVERTARVAEQIDAEAAIES
jgi:ADP-ribosylglycohydrolase